MHIYIYSILGLGGGGPPYLTSTPFQKITGKLNSVTYLMLVFDPHNARTRTNYTNTVWSKEESVLTTWQPRGTRET